jgi:hypothetical protein
LNAVEHRWRLTSLCGNIGGTIQLASDVAIGA